MCQRVPCNITSYYYISIVSTNVDPIDVQSRNCKKWKFMSVINLLPNKKVPLSQDFNSSSNSVSDYFFSSVFISLLEPPQQLFLEEQSFFPSQLLSFFFFLSPPSGRFTEKDLFDTTEAFTAGASVTRIAKITLKITFFIGL